MQRISNHCDTAYHILPLKHYNTVCCMRESEEENQASIFGYIGYRQFVSFEYFFQFFTFRSLLFFWLSSLAFGMYLNLLNVVVFLIISGCFHVCFADGEYFFFVLFMCCKSICPAVVKGKYRLGNKRRILKRS